MGTFSLVKKNQPNKKNKLCSRVEKVRFHSNLKEGNAKEGLNYHTIVLLSHASKIMLKILQVKL